MARKPVTIGPDQHRKLAVSSFNGTWTLIEKKRTRDEDLAMIHMAHASRHHWAQVGTPTHLAVGEWQVSHVYAVLRRAEPALYHARACLRICKGSGLGGFPLAYAYESLARASAVAGNRKDRDRYVRLGERAAKAIREPEDLAQFLRDIVSVR
jgi:hypothetical protein